MERWTDRETDRPNRLADRATEREDRRSILFCFMPLYSVLCLHKSEVRQIALECVNQRSWAGTRTSTRTRTDSSRSREKSGEEEGAWSGRVLNQLQLATLRCVDFFSAAGTADVAVAVAVGQGSDKTDYTDFMLGKSKNERAAIYILKFPPPTCPGWRRGGELGWQLLLLYEFIGHMFCATFVSCTICLLTMCIRIILSEFGITRNFRGFLFN